LGDERPLADPLDAHDEAFVRIRACDQRVAFEPVLRGQPPHPRREQREHRLEREEAEVLAVRDAHATRLRDLEVVADLEPAHGPALDPLDRHAEVVEAHLGHPTTPTPIARVGLSWPTSRSNVPLAGGSTSIRGWSSFSSAWRSSWSSWARRSSTSRSRRSRRTLGSASPISSGSSTRTP